VSSPAIPVCPVSPATLSGPISATPGVHSVDSAANPVAAPKALGPTVRQPTTFGVDALGRIYVGTAAGDVYRIDPSPSQG
jgi:hypothetical protein